MEGKQNGKGVVLLSHIPHGFFEPQMFEFFSQFGDVTRMKLIRSKKTGRSRHFAFIEFQFEEVAKVVAETMNNYLMFRKILKCKLIPSEELKSTTFKNWRSIHRVSKTRRIAIKEHNAEQTDPIKIEFQQKKMKAKRENLQKKLDDLGIDYNIFNIKVNDSFVPPERTRASPEDVADANAPLPEYTGERFSEFEDSEEESGKTEDIDEESVTQEQNISTNQDEDEDIQKLDGTESQSDKNEDFGVMVVDLEDPEITFKSPPTDAQIRRKSIGVAKRPEEFVQTPKRARDSRQGRLKTEETPKQKRLRKLKELEQALDSPDEDESSESCENKKSTNPRIKRKSTSSCKKLKTKKSKLNRTL